MVFAVVGMDVGEDEMGRRWKELVIELQVTLTHPNSRQRDHLRQKLNRQEKIQKGEIEEVQARIKIHSIYSTLSVPHTAHKPVRQPNTHGHRLSITSTIAQI